MKREIVNFVQGSDAWHAHRDGSYNASESPSMLNINGAHTSRSELIRQVATGIRPEVDAHTQKRFDEGHRAEALARPLAEEIIGDDLFPSTMTLEVEGLKRKLSASLDGRTMDDATTWEHKLLNNALAASLSIGIIPEKYHPQMEQGLMITGAKRCLFMASAWDDYENLIEEKHVWYESNPELRAKLIPGWKQFELDVESYQHVEQAPAAAATNHIALPAVVVEVVGKVAVRENIGSFTTALADFVAKLNRTPETDEDFANLDHAVKVLKEAEQEMDAADKQLDLAGSVADVRKLVASARSMARENRLFAEKLVKTEKENRREKIVQEGRTLFALHVSKLNNRIGGDYMPVIAFDPAGVTKGKKNLTSIADAVASEVARAKIEANEIADRIEINIKSITGEGHDWRFLFPDLKAVCWSSVEDFSNRLTARIASHNEAEDKRRAAERERIRQEEAARIEREQKAEQDRIAAEARRVEEEAKRVAADGARLAAEAVRVKAEHDMRVAEENRLRAEREQAEAAAKAAAAAAAAATKAAAEAEEKDFKQLSERDQTIATVLAAMQDMSDNELKIMLHTVDRILTGRNVAA